MTTSETWRYFVHDGKVFCPRRLADIDVGACSTCTYLRGTDNDDGRRAIVCLPPPGDTTRSRLAALLG
jgi:hypothetical protein